MALSFFEKALKIAKNSNNLKEQNLKRALYCDLSFQYLNLNEPLIAKNYLKEGISEFPNSERLLIHMEVSLNNVRTIW